MFAYEDETDRLDRDIDFLVMDYLISHGYPDTAMEFAKEAGLTVIEDESIEARVAIRHAIHKGDIDAAINKINDLDPQVRSVFCITSWRWRAAHNSCVGFSVAHYPFMIKPSFMHHA